MNALHSLVPSWLHRKDDDNMPDEMAPLPPVATMPERQPEFTAQDEDKMIFGRAAVMLEQLKRDREDALRREQELQVQLAEAVLARQGDARKIELLELDLAQTINDKAALESSNQDFRRLFSNVKAILDNLGIKAPEKKRKAKAKEEIVEPTKQELDAELTKAMTE